MSTISRNSTLRKTVREAAAAYAPSADAVLEALPNPLFVLDLSGHVIRINHAAEEFLAKSRTLVLGRLLASFFRPHPVLSRMLQHGRNESQSGGSITAEITVTLHDGSSQDVLAWLAPVSDGAGMVLTFFRDEVRALMARNDAQDQAGKSLGALAFMLAHEVKNPLSGMRGAAQLLRESANSADIPMAQLIMDECDRVARLVERVEHLSDEELPGVEAVNIHTVLDHVVLLAKGGFAAHCRFENRYDPSLPPVKGNFDQLVQLILNLVKNAAEATTRSGGTIVLTTGWQPRARSLDPHVQDVLALPVVISVSDSGSGISADLQKSLFTTPVSSKPGGQGLGLPIAARIAARHGGHIRIASEPGHTIVTVSLPHWTEEKTP